MDRDNFTEQTKRILMERVGGLCSNPNCRANTTGPVSDPGKRLNGGTAAHICAARPGGPRYDSSMDSEKRKSVENGIWLCKRCGWEIDQDETHYTVALLHQWKQQAERYAEQSCGIPQRDLWSTPHRIRGTFDEEKELKKAHDFINLISNEFNEILYNSSYSDGRALPSGKKGKIFSYGSGFLFKPWNSMNQYWSFNPEFNRKQSELLKLLEIWSNYILGQPWGNPNFYYVNRYNFSGKMDDVCYPDNHSLNQEQLKEVSKNREIILQIKKSIESFMTVLNRPKSIFF